MRVLILLCGSRVRIHNVNAHFSVVDCLSIPYSKYAYNNVLYNHKQRENIGADTSVSRHFDPTHFGTSAEVDPCWRHFGTDVEVSRDTSVY